MPQLGHGLVGLGIAAATYPDVRSPALRCVWMGLGVSLAYLPDLVEWGLRWAGVQTVHSAPASVPSILVEAAVVALAMRVFFAERGFAAPAAVLAMIASHSVLDGLDGGIPLFWPLSSALMGPNWLGTIGDAPGGRLGRELLVFAPFVLIGLVVGAMRWRSPRGWRERRSGWWHVMQIIAVSPVLLLGVFQLMAWREMRTAYAHHNRGEYESAIPHYQRAAELHPVDWEHVARFRVDYCLFRAGFEREALKRFLAALRMDADRFDYNSGLAELYLLARDASLRRAAEGRRLLDRLTGLATSEEERTYARLLRERIDRTLGEEREGEPDAIRSHSGADAIGSQSKPSGGGR